MPKAGHGTEMDDSAATHPGRHATARLTGLILTYVVLGLIGMGVAGVGVFFADPCSPFAASSEGTAYTDFADTVMGGFGMLYVAASVPLAIWRKRKIAWLIVALAFLASAVGAVAVLLTAAPGGTFCDLGGGL